MPDVLVNKTQLSKVVSDSNDTHLKRRNLDKDLVIKASVYAIVIYSPNVHIW